MSARIDVPDEARGFKAHVRDDLVLITPRREKMSRSDWADDELALRSVVLRASTREVLSAGFPKFFNAAESGSATAQLSPEAQRLNIALAAGEPVWFTDKVDGSLCIRSVIDGEVMLRTRGVLPPSPHSDAMRAAAAARYPILLDPAFCPDVSLLFEFVSPEFRIILSYERDDLILLGAVNHSDLTLWDVPELQRLATEHALTLVEIVELPIDPDALIEAVGAMEGREGVVARCDGGATMVKLKSFAYLALHRLRFSLSAKAVRAICVERDVQNLGDFSAYLAEHDADWELMNDLRPLVDAFLAARNAAVRKADALGGRVAAQVEAGTDRKAFAIDFAVPLGGASTAAAFSLLDGDTVRAFALLRDAELDVVFADLVAADQRRLESLDL